MSSESAALAVAGDRGATAHARHNSGAKLVWICICQGIISPGSRALSLAAAGPFCRWRRKEHPDSAKGRRTAPPAQGAGSVAW